jgi:hypothetical protein
MQQINEENAAKLREFSKNYFTEAQFEQLRVWTEEYTTQNAQVLEQKRNENMAALKRMVAEGESPASPAAQALVQDFADTIVQITHGDRDLLMGVRKMFMDLGALPESQLPMASSLSKEEGEFMKKAFEIYGESHNVTL